MRLLFSFQDDIKIHLYPYSAHLGQENSSCKYMQIHEVVMHMLNLQFKYDHDVKKKASAPQADTSCVCLCLPTDIEVWVEWG